MFDITKPFEGQLPRRDGELLRIGQLTGSGLSLTLHSIAQAAQRLLLVVTPDVVSAQQMQRELQFFSGYAADFPIMIFSDWETLPYDSFSPHPDIISERMRLLSQLPALHRGILLVSANTLLQRLPPRHYLEANSFVIRRGQHLSIPHFRSQLDAAGYRCVHQVMEHGEYAVRGSLLDVFPMGSTMPFRLDLLDDEIDSLRTFDTDTQRTETVIESIELLPAHEFPLDPEGINQFRQAWRTRFSGDPTQSPLYQSISQAQSAPGVEYYLPLFFQHTHTLRDYLPKDVLCVQSEGIHSATERFWLEVKERFEQLRHDVTRPLLPPSDLFLTVDQLFAELNSLPKIQVQADTLPKAPHVRNLSVKILPNLAVNHQLSDPWQALRQELAVLQTIPHTRIAFCVETAGRREVLESRLSALGISPHFYENWQTFLADSAPIGLLIAPLEQGLWLENPPLILITENQLLGQPVMQARLPSRRVADPEAIIRDLTELKIGDPVVHIEHGVGRYQGLQLIQTGDYEAEYLTLVYADNTKLYVPIGALHLISRYSGGDPDLAPLHRLGSPQWEKAKRKAQEKIRDIAAELLNIYAQRAAKTGFTFDAPSADYDAFAMAFPFEETADQKRTIQQVISDLCSPLCMDRVVCGDVGFGKTEVAMRAAFLAVQSHQQVAVLVPTTLLAEQHLNSFQDRFAPWPIKIAALSRFRSKEEQTQILAGLKSGQIDIVIGTHKLLQGSIEFKSLRLLIVDEEHRFGVRQKERIKALRAEIDLLTLTATPIPRTLNMALGQVRDLSIIATPPQKRLSVKTFVREYQPALVREAVLREILRGGQVYFLHNEVRTIEKIAQDLQALLPEVRIQIAHGQMREQQLERIMRDFYHQRFHLLVATTIIESGIDVPTANTMIIHRADCFGLAQLHQLRGRVGRSHHQAYAYLLTPPPKVLTADAKKRLEAIAALEELGSGFLLATHDLEIRGAGEILGEEQSGHIHEIGFSLYMDLLTQTVEALKSGQEITLEAPLPSKVEINSKIPALLPSSYVGDVHTRLLFYKRLAGAKDAEELQALQIELVDRFGLLPPAAKTLFQFSELKFLAGSLDVKKLDISLAGGVIEFYPQPCINMANLLRLVQKHPQVYQISGGEKLRFTHTAERVSEQVAFIQQVLQGLRT